MSDLLAGLDECARLIAEMDTEQSGSDVSAWIRTRDKAERGCIAFLREFGPAIRECVADAERYRWLRENFRFANDSVWKIWFNAGVITRKSDSALLDSTIDDAQESP